MMTSSALFARSLRRTCLAIVCAAGTSLAAQTVLPAYPTNQVERKDWLVDKIETKVDKIDIKTDKHPKQDDQEPTEEPLTDEEQEQ